MSPAPKVTSQDYWDKVQEVLKQEIGVTAFNTWIKPLSFQGLLGDQIHLNAPSRYVQNWVSSNYTERIRILWQKVEGFHQALRPVRVDVGESLTASNLAANTVALSPPTSRVGVLSGDNNESAQTSETTDPIQQGLSADLDGRFTFENFVVGKPNELAYAAAQRVADSTTISFNPFFIYGGVGLGKTHLMHAIAWRMKERAPNKKVLYLSAEQFMYRFIQALRQKDTMSFKQQFRSVDVLMVDDVQFISSKESTQEEFFHTFNALIDQNCMVVVSSDKSPSDLQGIEERLRSRLGWGLVVDIHPTSYELRLGILQAKMENIRVPVPTNVLEFLAHRITSNVRELEGALNRIVAYAELIGRPVTLESTQDALQDLLRANDRRVTIEDIQKKVAEHYNIKVADMFSVRRTRAIARPRQIAMYLAKMLTSKSLPEIGKKFGGRDHTTVMHAARTIEDMSATDKDLAEDIELLRRSLGG